MPAKGASKLKDRECLVCEQMTRIAHLGVECCRACAVFYRRAKRGNDFICRSNTGLCPTGKSLSCKRCRLDRIKTLLQGCSQVGKVADTGSPTSTPMITFYPFLERARTQYNAMNFTRLTNELLSRSESPHPLDISLEKGPFFPADIANLTSAMKVLLIAALEFGRNTFPEFSGLSDDEKWALSLNFFYRFRVFEGNYRAIKLFPDEPSMFFISYATYTPMPFGEAFFKTAPPGADAEGATKYMSNANMCNHMRTARELVARVDPSEEEVIVVAILMFWTLESPGSSPSTLEHSAVQATCLLVRKSLSWASNIVERLCGRYMRIIARRWVWMITLHDWEN